MGLLPCWSPDRNPVHHYVNKGVPLPARKMVQRVTYRTRSCYNTRSNRIKLVKTPGGKLSVQYRSKLAKGPKCGTCGDKLFGIRHLDQRNINIFPKGKRLCAVPMVDHVAVDVFGKRLFELFLLEEQKIVKKVESTIKESSATTEEKLNLCL